MGIPQNVAREYEAADKAKAGKSKPKGRKYQFRRAAGRHPW